MSETSAPNRPLREQLFTWANLVSILRLACVPLFVWLLLAEERRLAAAGLLAFVGATDWDDGYLARRLNQDSDVGKILAPTADRVLFLVAIVAMLIDGSVPVWFGVATLVREVVVSLAAIVLGILGARRSDVTWWGKTSTFGLMFAFPLFLVGNTDVFWAQAAEVAAYAIGVPSLVLHYYAGFGYVPLALRALRDGRTPEPEVM